MSWANYQDVLGQLQSAGLDVDHLEIGTRQPVRCREKDGDHEKRGWYWLSDIELDHNRQDGSTGKALFIVGSFGIYRGVDPGKMKVKLGARAAITDDQKRAIAARHSENLKRSKALREAEARKAAAKAIFAWSKYLTEGQSDYLVSKGVGAYGIRFAPSGNGSFAVPMCDVKGQIHGLQIIRGKNREAGKRQKDYWPKGLSKLGRFHLIGSPRDVLLVAEGYATAATLHEATGLPVAVCFDAGNLLPVVQALHQAYRSSRIIVCADDDYLTRNQQGDLWNPGIEYARAAAHAVGGLVAIPEFPADRCGKKLTDFNDLAQFPEAGIHLVARQIEAVIEAAGIAPKSNVRAGDVSKGAGDNGATLRRNAVSILPLDQAVERFIPIDDGTGKYLFDNWTMKLVMREQMQALLPAGIRGDDIKRHPVWSTRGAYYLDEVGFDPTGTDAEVRLNTWTGWPIQPKAGKCEAILELLHYLCNNEAGRGEEVYNWLLRWMAYPLQNPGAKMASAVIMHGPQGTGKSAVFQTLARIYGKYSTVLNQRGLEDKFNSDWADSKLFILAEEVVTRAEMWHIKNELKELVTGEWIRVNPKNVAAYRQRNQVNIVYLSNEGQPLPLENDDRRHLVVWTPPKLDDSVYDEVWDEIEHGGAEALYHHLLQLDMGDFHPKKRPPMTDAKKELIHLSLPSEDRFVKEWVDGELQWPFMPCTSRQLYTAYLRWCRENGVRNPRESNQFIGRLTRTAGWSNTPRWFYTTAYYAEDSKVQQRVLMPSQTQLESANCMRPKEKTISQWITDCFIKFSNALGNGDDHG